MVVERNVDFLLDFIPDDTKTPFSVVPFSIISKQLRSFDEELIPERESSDMVYRQLAIIMSRGRRNSLLGIPPRPRYNALSLFAIE